MLHWNTVSPELKKLLQSTATNKSLNCFRLGGGTALALQLGHRVSIDADYISETQFDKTELSLLLSKEIKDPSDLYIGELGVFLKSNGIKLDFLSWNIPFIRPSIIQEGLSLLHVEEIAAMKLFAITQRGEKKDYFDIAVLLQSYSLEQLIAFYSERHPANDTSVVIRFLVSFSDIDFQPEPNTVIDFNWNQAKEILQFAVKNYLKR